MSVTGSHRVIFTIALGSGVGSSGGVHLHRVTGAEVRVFLIQLQVSQLSGGRDGSPCTSASPSTIIGLAVVAEGYTLGGTHTGSILLVDSSAVRSSALRAVS